MKDDKTRKITVPQKKGLRNLVQLGKYTSIF